MDINSIKSKVLDKLISEMDSRMVNDLKSKSPKFAKVEVAAKDPQSLEEGLDKAKDLLSSDVSESESPMEMMHEKKDPSLEENESEDEDLQKLYELYKQLK